LFLAQNPERGVEIEGHTDSTGSPGFNQTLSERRAQEVRGALIARGVQGARIAARGLGPTAPVASNDTSAGRQQNRRVEIIIVSKG
jgi:outer membrane protein OmpA-like peptidoglycan-associated protein